MNDHIDMSLPPRQMVAPIPPAPVLPRLPRNTNLVAAESHERYLRTMAGVAGDDSAITAAVSAQRAMIRSLDALEAVRQARHPSDTPARLLDRAAEGYRQMIKANAQRHDAAREQIRNRKSGIEAEISQRLGLTVSGDSAEIRQALRSMPSEERGKAIQAAIESKDGAVLQAVFSGRQITTGVSDTQRESFRRRAEELHAPELLSLRRALVAADHLVSGAFDGLVEMDQQAAGAPRVRTEYERQATAHDEAMLALARAMS